MTERARGTWFDEAKRRHVPSDHDVDVAGIIAPCMPRGVSWVTSRRIPSRRGDDPSTLDLVAVSPYALVALELRHWNGAVDPATSHSWVQVAERGERREHDDPLRVLREKVHDLHHLLAREGLAVNAGAVRSFLVLTHSRVQVGPVASKRPDVTTRGQLTKLLKPIFHPDAGARRGGPGTPPRLTQGDAVMDLLRAQPQWDRVTLHGGRVIAGEVLGEGVRTPKGEALGRTRTATLRFDTGRTLWARWKTPRVRWSDGTSQWTAPLAPDATLQVRRHDTQAIETLPAAWVTRLDYGWRHEAAEADEATRSPYHPGTLFHGRVRQRDDLGLTIDLDGHREGLLHVAQLQGAGRRLVDYRVEEAIVVRVTTAQWGREGLLDLELVQ